MILFLNEFAEQLKAFLMIERAVTEANCAILVPRHVNSICSLGILQQIMMEFKKSADVVCVDNVMEIHNFIIDKEDNYSLPLFIIILDCGEPFANLGEIITKIPIFIIDSKNSSFSLNDEKQMMLKVPNTKDDDVPSSIQALELAKTLLKANWVIYLYSIIGLTDSFLQNSISHEQYLFLFNSLQKEFSVEVGSELFPNSNNDGTLEYKPNTDRVSVNNCSIYPIYDFRVPFLTISTISEAFNNSDYLSQCFGTWNESGIELFNQMMSSTGLQRFQNEKFYSISDDDRLSIITNMVSQYPDFAFPSLLLNNDSELNTTISDIVIVLQKKLCDDGDFSSQFYQIDPFSELLAIVAQSIDSAKSQISNINQVSIELIKSPNILINLDHFIMAVSHTLIPDLFPVSKVAKYIEEVTNKPVLMIGYEQSSNEWRSILRSSTFYPSLDKSTLVIQLLQSAKEIEAPTSFGSLNSIAVSSKGDNFLSVVDRFILKVIS